jgi:TolB-like protein/tetratricopeptide (TPR) repeat protein
MNLKKFFLELKRRNVYKVAITYAIVGWLLAQMAGLAVESFDAPTWVIKMIIVVLLLGFPVALILAWAFEMSPEGMIKTSSVAANENPYSSSKKKPLTSKLFIGFLIILVIGQFAYNRYWPGQYSNSSAHDSISTLNNSIAVLPFDDMSSGGDTEWFCDGVTEDILTNLSKIESLRVISRTSTERYRETDLSIPEIAKELGVSYIVEGSVRKHKDNVLITAQLIDKSDTRLWSDNFNEKLDDVFKIQEEVSKKIVEQLKISISPKEERALSTAQTNNIEAYQLFLKGRSVADVRSESDLQKSIDLFQQAIDLDPNYADAYAEMAYSYILLIYEHIKYDDVIEKINALIEKALEINPNTVRAYMVKANLAGRDGSWEEAKINFEKALAINPNDATTHHHFANYFGEIPVPDVKKRLVHISIAQELDPFSISINRAMFRALIANLKYEEAEEHFKKMSFLFREEDKLEFKIILKSLQNKDWSEAIHVFENAIKENPNESFLYRELGYAYDEILNDDDSWVTYSKMAYQMDSTNTINANAYYNSLIENGNFREAINFLQSENYKALLSEKMELESLFYYNYHRENYKKAEELLKNELFSEAYFEKLITQAQLGKINDVKKVFEDQEISNTDKAFLYAIFKERDSMYHYLKQEDIKFRFVNSRVEFDPYRKEEQYIAFLKRNYLPVTHWNE